MITITVGTNDNYSEGMKGSKVSFLLLKMIESSSIIILFKPIMLMKESMFLRTTVILTVGIILPVFTLLM